MRAGIGRKGKGERRQAMKKGDVVIMNHPAFGRYGLVTGIRGGGKFVDIISRTGLRLDYEAEDAKSWFGVLGFLRVEAEFVVGRGQQRKKFRTLEVDGVRCHFCLNCEEGGGVLRYADDIRKAAFGLVCDRLEARDAGAAAA